MLFRSKARIELEHKANYDYLTGLHNRAYFFNRLFEEDKNNKIVVVYMDLDNFKLINDTQGHDTGDGVLRIIGEVLKKYFKNCVISRIGGDEFTLLIDDGRTLTHLFDELHNFQNELYRSIDNQLLKLGFAISIGISSNYHRKSISFDQLMMEADIALYYTKENNKGDCLLYEKNMENSINHQMHFKSQNNK